MPACTVCGAGGGEGTHGITRERKRPRRIPSDRGGGRFTRKIYTRPRSEKRERRKVGREGERERSKAEIFFSTLKLSPLSIISFFFGRESWHGRRRVDHHSIASTENTVGPLSTVRLSFLPSFLSFFFHIHLFSPSTFCPGNASGGGKKVGNARHEMG